MEEEVEDIVEVGEVVPFWETCDNVTLNERIRRLERALRYCRGRASDIREHVEEHIRFLKGVREQRFLLQRKK